MRPKNTLVLQVDRLVEGAVEGEVVGGGVIVCAMLVRVSQHPQKNPGVSHVEVVIGAVGDVGVGGLVGSRQPNHPGWVHDVVVVNVGMVVVPPGVGSLQPNHPGVLQVEVDVLVADDVDVVVVVSSKQPHQPGVLQVEVLVVVVELVVEVVVVVISEPLLLKNFQSTQSKHSSSLSQVGTSS